VSVEDGKGAGDVEALPRGRLALVVFKEDLWCSKNSPNLANNSGESAGDGCVELEGIGEDSASSEDFSSSEDSGISEGRFALLEVRLGRFGETLGGITCGDSDPDSIALA
jgi:hypothetical protein